MPNTHEEEDVPALLRPTPREVRRRRLILHRATFAGLFIRVAEENGDSISASPFEELAHSAVLYQMLCDTGMIDENETPSIDLVRSLYYTLNNGGAPVNNVAADPPREGGVIFSPSPDDGECDSDYDDMPDLFSLEINAAADQNQAPSAPLSLDVD